MSARAPTTSAFAFSAAREISYHRAASVGRRGLDEQRFASDALWPRLAPLAVASCEPDENVFDIQFCAARDLWLAALDGQGRGTLALLDPRSGNGSGGDGADAGAKRACVVDYLRQHTGAVNNICVAPNGCHVFTGSDDHTIKCWDLRTRRVIQTLIGHRDGLKNVELLPSAAGDGDGGAPQRLLSAAFDGTVRTWDLTQAAPHGRVVHTDRNLVRMRVVPPPAHSGTAAPGLVMSLCDGSLVLIHDLDVSSAAAAPDSEPVAPSEVASPVLFDSDSTSAFYAKLYSPRDPTELLPIPSCLTRTSNRVEFVQGHYRDHLAALPSRNRAAEVTVNFSLELSSNAHYLVTRGFTPSLGTDRCSVYDLRRSNLVGDRLCALQRETHSADSVARREILLRLSAACAPPVTRLALSFADSHDPRDAYCKASTFACDDTLIASPYYRGVRLLHVPRALLAARDRECAARERAEATESYADDHDGLRSGNEGFNEPNETDASCSASESSSSACASSSSSEEPVHNNVIDSLPSNSPFDPEPPAIGGSWDPQPVHHTGLATCHRRTCLVARVSAQRLMLASGGLDQCVVFQHPCL